ncbi:hypothetical protein ASD15_11635 [Massilia sp. Root351]|uniref:hypothetical protein n=1 Tax=Massilia sp. Root351 TaxID=1736522 RepID=UPI00070B6FC1|nr:hypothetical protein [Massilia sp. Root351]KQV80594.1 hypothetical protein ASD15_11635 [Massilia sp. Root351]
MQASLKDIFLSVLKLWPRRKGAAAVTPAQPAAAPKPPAIPLRLIGAAMGEQVDEDALRAETTAWMKATGQGKLDAPSDFWRALALATSATRELATMAGAHKGLAQPSEAALPRLQLIALLPAEWKGPWRDAAGRWLQHQLVSAGWPVEQVDRNARRNQHPTQVLTALKHSTQPCLALLLACGAQAGEGAAALLLADTEQAALLGAGPYPLLQSVAEGRADPGSHTPAPGFPLLRTLAQQAIKPLPVAVPLAAAETPLQNPLQDPLHDPAHAAAARQMHVASQA